MRTSQLARATGVSSQTVRNLEDRRVLPPTRRSSNGYRQYSQVHLDALHAYQDLSRAFGAAPAGDIMIRVTEEDTDAAVDTITRLVARLHRDGEHLDQLGESVGRVPRRPHAEPMVGSRSIIEVARHLDLRTSTLRVWEREGLVAPDRDRSGHRVYRPLGVQQAATVQALRSAGIGIPRIRAIFDAVSTGAVTDLAEALDRRSCEIREQKRRAITAMSSLHTCIAHQG